MPSLFQAQSCFSCVTPNSYGSRTREPVPSTSSPAHRAAAGAAGVEGDDPTVLVLLEVERALSARGRRGGPASPRRRCTGSARSCPRTGRPGCRTACSAPGCTAPARRGSSPRGDASPKRRATNARRPAMRSAQRSWSWRHASASVVRSRSASATGDVVGADAVAEPPGERAQLLPPSLRIERLPVRDTPGGPSAGRPQPGAPPRRRPCVSSQSRKPFVQTL